MIKKYKECSLRGFNNESFRGTILIEEAFIGSRVFLSTKRWINDPLPRWWEPFKTWGGHYETKPEQYIICGVNSSIWEIDDDIVLRKNDTYFE
jgi:hypothetical protein